MQLEPLSPAIGARVSGIDLCAGISAAERDALLDALHTHHVLFFEKQPLTPVQHRDLAAHFGSLHIHPVYPSVPEAALRDERLYAMLSLFDALRAGQARERNAAQELLDKYFQ